MMSIYIRGETDDRGNVMCRDDTPVWANRCSGPVERAIGSPSVETRILVVVRIRHRAHRHPRIGGVPTPCAARVCRSDEVSCHSAYFYGTLFRYNLY